MVLIKKIALGTICLVWLSLSGCSSPTSLPVAPTAMRPSNTAQPTFVPTWTLTPIPPTQTRLPTRTVATAGPSAVITSIMTYTATVSNRPTKTMTLTPKPGQSTATFTPAPVDNTETPTDTPTSTMTATLFDSGIILSQTLGDKSIVPAGKSFQVTFTLKNTGTSTWTGTYTLKWFSGLPGYSMYPTNKVPVPQDVHPGETVAMTITCLAPSTAGPYFSMWFLQDSSTGINFVKAYIEVEVK